jgi:S-DNA-T family DNA segregation ATPase FtsK/SpoIIIE
MPLIKLPNFFNKSQKPAGKTLSAKKGGSKAAPKGKPQAAPPPPPAPAAPTWWEQLSAERKLDVIGIIITFIGVIILLGLISTNRSDVIGGVIFFLSQIFGWGVYILPLGLLVFGMWLVLRKIERIPPLSVERVAGSVLLFLWLLTTLHFLISTADTAEAEALQGRGGGALGGLFLRFIWFWLGEVGMSIALIAWLIIGISVTLDKPVPELFRWMLPLIAQLRKLISKPAVASAAQAAPQTIPASTSAAEDEFIPIDPSAVPKVTRTVSGPTVIEWKLPKVADILDTGNAPAINEDFIQARARLIEETLASFGAPAQVVAISRGPSITQFGVEPLFIETRGGVKTKVRVSKIASLGNDLALALAAPRIRIQAPVPGHGYVGIEVPNDEMAVVALRDLLETETYKKNTKPMVFGLGRDVADHPIIASLESMPHMLIAGTTGSGKSVCVNSILTCLLLHNTPDDLRLVLVDPKRVELTGYNGIPHLLGPVVVEMDRVIGALQWMTREMDKRYHMFAQAGSRNIFDYNVKMKAQGQKKLPYLVVIIDELADLMMIAPEETERTITRLAQLARATGIHLILATQRPSVDVVTGLIKANFPARIAFAVASNTDSRVILDQPGAEKLLGRGDMLYQAPEAPSPVRLQGVFVSDHEIHKLTDFWRDQAGTSIQPPATDDTPANAIPTNVPLKQAPLWEDGAKVEGDPLYDDAVNIIRKEGKASVSMLQRRLRIGYTRASRLVDTMEDKGIVGPPEGGTQMRPVLDFGDVKPDEQQAGNQK